MNTRFTASESVEMIFEETSVPIRHYLRQPQRVVRAIAEPKLMEQLSPNRFRFKMHPLNFVELYQFQPVVALKVWADADGTVHVASESCEIQGIQDFNERFSLTVTGELYPHREKDKTCLKGKADLQIEVDLPPPLRLMPKSVLETAGNGLLKSVLLRIKNRLLKKLQVDYRQWADEHPPSSPARIATAENPTA
ncbi:MAG: DUF1997 domain-containing protein [Cyanophyceae cyanobacterium]